MTALRGTSGYDEIAKLAKNFTQVTNAAAQDRRLSGLARAIILLVLSMPPEKNLTTTWLDTQFPDSKRAMRRALDELEQFGYYRKTRRSGGRGVWIWEQVVTDTPALLGKPSVSPREGTANPPADPVSSTQGWSDELTCGNTASSQVVSSAHLTSDVNTSDVNRADKNVNTEELKYEDQSQDQSARASEPLLGVVVAAPEPMIDMILSEVEERTSVKIPRHHAADVAAQILGRARSKPRDPVKFVRTAIRREENPRNFVPSNTPPPYRPARTPVSVDPWATPPRPSTTDRAVREAQALKAQLAETREHLEDPVDLNAQMAAMFGNRPAGRVA